MTDYVTIRVPEEAHEEAKEAKEQAGQTWAEYLTDESRGGADPESVATELTAQLNLDATDAKEELREIQETLESIQNDWEYLNAEEIHGGVHESDHQLKDVLNRLDDLENTLPRKVREVLR